MIDIITLRKEFNLDQTEDIFFNAGSSGPVPQTAWAGMDRYREIVIRHGACGPKFHAQVDPQLAELRQWIAELISAGSSSEIAFTAHTTHGLGLALNARKWVAGEKILLADSEYITGKQNCELLALRYNAEVVEFAFSSVHRYDHERFLEQLHKHRPSMVLVSHVTYNTAEILPVQKICQATRDIGALSLVDGAQSVGQIDVNVRELGCDFYAFPAHKWLGGPEGAGFLYVRQDIVKDCLPLTLGYLSNPFYPPVHPMTLHDNARRFETASPAFPSLFAIHGALSVIRKVGLKHWQARIRQLVMQVYRELEKRPGVILFTPPADWGRTGLIPFRLENESPDATVMRLGQAGIICRTISHPDCLRISLHPANTETEVNHFLEIL